MVELMVAIVAGLIVVGAGIALLTSTFGSNSSALRTTRMNQDLRSILHAISYDITRAGSWSISPLISEATASADLSFSSTTGTVTASALQRGSSMPYSGFAASLGNAALSGRSLVMFVPNSAGVTTRYTLSISAVASTSSLTVVIPAGTTLPTTTIRAGSWTIVNPFTRITLNGSNDCVLFSYDLDGDGTQGTNEMFGYRFDATDNAIEASTASTSCTDASGWQNITDEDVLTVNQFSVTQIATPVVAVGLLNTQVREYSVTLGGVLRSDNTAQRSLRTMASVRNHLVQ